MFTWEIARVVKAEYSPASKGNRPLPGESGIEKLIDDTGYNLFEDFNEFESEPAGTHSAEYLGLKVKHLPLDPTRLEVSESNGKFLGWQRPSDWCIHPDYDRIPAA